MLIEMDKNTVFQLVNMEMETFEQTLSLQKDGDIGFLKKTPFIGTFGKNFIKRNRIPPPNNLMYFNIYLMISKNQ